MEELNLAFEEFLKTQSAQIPLFNFSINLILSGFLSWILSIVYIKYGNSISNRKLFAKNLITLNQSRNIIDKKNKLKWSHLSNHCFLT